MKRSEKENTQSVARGNSVFENMPKHLIGPRVMGLQKLIRQAFNQAASDEGLFSGQQEVLFAVVDNNGITIGELAELIDVSVATASVSVKRMERSGFIRKKADKNDARIVHLFPTKKATNILENIRNKMKNLENTISKGMSEEDVLKLNELLEKARANLIERGEHNA